MSDQFKTVAATEMTASFSCDLVCIVDRGVGTEQETVIDGSDGLQTNIAITVRN